MTVFKKNFTVIFQVFSMFLITGVSYFKTIIKRSISHKIFTFLGNCNGSDKYYW